MPYSADSKDALHLMLLDNELGYDLKVDRQQLSKNLEILAKEHNNLTASGFNELNKALLERIVQSTDSVSPNIFTLNFLGDNPTEQEVVRFERWSFA